MSQRSVARTTPVQPSLDHFLFLARNGRRVGASGGEKRAARLYDAIVEDLPGLDADACRGLVELIALTYRAPQTARDLVA